MNISIPLFSLPMLAAAILIALGLLITPLSSRLGVVGIGIGTILMGGAVLLDLPKGFEIQAAVLFGMPIVVGIWMVSVGLRERYRS